MSKDHKIMSYNGKIVFSRHGEQDGRVTRRMDSSPGSDCPRHWMGNCCRLTTVPDDKRTNLSQGSDWLWEQAGAGWVAVDFNARRRTDGLITAPRWLSATNNDSAMTGLDGEQTTRRPEDGWRTKNSAHTTDDERRSQPHTADDEERLSTHKADDECHGHVSCISRRYILSSYHVTSGGL